MQRLIPHNLTGAVITSAARDGSSMLASLLGGHPQVVSPGELCSFQLMRAAGWKPHADELRAVHRTFARAAARGFQAAAVKLQVQQARRVPLRSTLAAEGVRVIHARRSDLLAKYVSHMIAQRTQRWRIGEAADRTTETLRVDPGHFAGYRRAMQAAWDRSLADFAGCPSTVVWYEHACLDRCAALRPVWDLLGVEPADVAPRTVQQETRPMREVVENWDELVAAGLAAE